MGSGGEGSGADCGSHSCTTLHSPRLHPLLPETLAPADQAAVADAVREAGRSGRAVYPMGGGTMLDYGMPPTRPGVRLSHGQAQPRGRLSGRRHDDHGRGRADDRRVERAIGGPSAMAAGGRAVARPGDRRRGHRHRRGRPAAVRLRHDPRLPAGLHGGRRRRDGVFRRRPGGEKCRRLQLCAG